MQEWECVFDWSVALVYFLSYIHSIPKCCNPMCENAIQLECLDLSSFSPSNFHQVNSYDVQLLFPWFIFLNVACSFRQRKQLTNTINKTCVFVVVFQIGFNYFIDWAVKSPFGNSPIGGCCKIQIVTYSSCTSKLQAETKPNLASLTWN